MANLEDKETPNIIKPKRNKRYSKRVVITLAAVGTLVMLVIGMAATTQPKSRPRRSRSPVPAARLTEAMNH